MGSTSLSERLRAAVRQTTEESGRFKQLSGDSGISDASWRAWWYGRQRPTAEMIEAVCQHSPHYALWITTGVDAPRLGQEAALGPYEDSLTGAEYPDLPEVRRYLALRVQASKERTQGAINLALANERLVMSELQHYYGVPDED